MKTIIIAAMTRDRVIGREGGVPWHEAEDLRHFKRTTTGHAVIMGRKTFESISKPLPNRRNIVVTRNPDYKPPEPQPPGPDPRSPIANRQSSIDVVHSLDEALGLCRDRNEEKAFIVGGAKIYELALPIADEMIITRIDRDDVTGDTYFPLWNPDDWEALPSAGSASLTVARYRRKRHRTQS